MRIGILLLLFWCMMESINAQVSFIERSLEAGLAFTYDDTFLMGGGAVAFDFDNDGDEDLYVVGGNKPDALFENDGAANFTNVSDQYGIRAATQGLMTTSVTTGDINNDGIREIFIGTYGPINTTKELSKNILLHRSDNTGKYIDIATDVNIKNESFCMGGHFADFNKDGLIDLYLMNYVEEPGFIYSGTEIIGFDHSCGRNMLYINQGDFFFTEKAAVYNLVDDGCTLAATTSDIDNDGDPDLIIANDFGEWLEPNQLYINDYPSPVFKDASASSQFDAKMYAMGIAVADYDEDLDFDFYVTNIGANRFFRNEGDQTFSEVSSALGLKDEYTTGGAFTTGWGTFFADINNDSYSDLFIANGFVSSDVDIDNQSQSDKLFICTEDFSFIDISDEAGVNFNGLSRGAIYADFNNDGKLDIVTVTNAILFPGTTNFIQYYENVSEQQNWIGFDLEGAISNKDAYGTKAILYFNDRKVLKAILGGSSHASQNSSRLHFGLGAASKVDSIALFWPSGIEQTIIQPSINQYHEIIEDSETLEEPILQTEVEQVIKMNPNPAHSYIEYLIPGATIFADTEITIISVGGMHVLSQKGIAKQGRLDISFILPGLYFVHFKSGSMNTTKKLLIN